MNLLDQVEYETENKDQLLESNVAQCTLGIIYDSACNKVHLPLSALSTRSAPV